jgi:hypothetical protein
MKQRLYLTYVNMCLQELIKVSIGTESSFIKVQRSNLTSKYDQNITELT